MIQGRAHDTRHYIIYIYTGQTTTTVHTSLNLRYIPYTEEGRAVHRNRTCDFQLCILFAAFEQHILRAQKTNTAKVRSRSMKGGSGRQEVEKNKSREGKARSGLYYIYIYIYHTQGHLGLNVKVKNIVVVKAGQSRGNFAKEIGCYTLRIVARLSNRKH